MTNSPQINVSLSPAERSSVAGMLVQLFDLWGLDTNQALALLGLAADDGDALERYRAGEPLDDRPELLERAGILFGIHKNLKRLFSRNPELAHAWVSTPNRAFDGRPPIKIAAVPGVDGLIRLRSYLDGALQM